MAAERLGDLRGRQPDGMTFAQAGTALQEQDILPGTCGLISRMNLLHELILCAALQELAEEIRGDHDRGKIPGFGW